MSKEKNVYQWAGVNRKGGANDGVIEADSLAIAKITLLKQGIILKKIIKKRKPLFDNKNKKIKPGNIAVFSRQLATMIEAGIPLIQSFDIISKGQSNARMQKLIEMIKKNVESGLTLAEALQKFPQFFNDLFCNLVDSGEKSGSLDTMLKQVATYKEKIESLKKKIKKALTYPLAVITVAFIVTAVLLIFVVPQFETLFNGFGAQLPALTQIVISLSRFFQAWWHLISSTIIGVIYGFIHAKKYSIRFANRLDHILLKIPVVGAIMEKASIARFSRTLAITFAAGLPLVEALTTVSGATGNVVYADACNKIRDDVSNGQQMNVAMSNTHVFPNMVIQMIAIGEESGTLERMLGKVANFYEEDVDNAVDSLSSLLEPIIMSILGILVGGLVIAMYLPIFKLGSVI